MRRCDWIGSDEELKYHDNEWGKPVYDDYILFEFLILEGMQAGLSWNTVLKKRESMRKAFDNFNPNKLIKYDDKKINMLMKNPEIIRHRLKLESLRQNAICFLKIQREYGSFSLYIWSFTNRKTIVNNIKSKKDMPVVSVEAIEMSKALKKAGFKFVGPTICYAYMQAVGLVNDHINTCEFK